MTPPQTPPRRCTESGCRERISSRATTSRHMLVLLITRDRTPANEDTQDQDYARYFFCPKVSKKERNAGCEDLPLQRAGWTSVFPERKTAYHNTHPTVKADRPDEVPVPDDHPAGRSDTRLLRRIRNHGSSSTPRGFPFHRDRAGRGYVEIARARLIRASERIQDAA